MDDDKRDAALALIGSVKNVARLQLARDLLDAIYDGWREEIITECEKDQIDELMSRFKERALESVRWNEELLSGRLVPLEVENGD